MIIVPAVPAVASTLPPSSGWTQVAMTGYSGYTDPTITADATGRHFAISNINQDWTCPGEFRTLAASSNYTVTAKITKTLFGGNRSHAMLALRNSSSGKLVTFGWEVFGSPTGNAGSRMVSYNLASSTTGNTTPAGTNYRETAGFTDQWLRIADNGTNRILSSSSDGVTWTARVTQSRINYITPNQIGWVMTNHAAGGDSTADLIHWQET